MNDVTHAQDLIGTDIYDRDGARIGRVGNVYVDDESYRPEWVTVRTGPLGVRESFVPLTGARIEEERVAVNVAKDKVKSAPKIDADRGHLSDEDGKQLYDHYGLGRVEVPGPRQSPAESNPDEPTSRTTTARPAEAITVSEHGRHHRPESIPRPGHLAPTADGPAGGRHRKED